MTRTWTLLLALPLAACGGLQESEPPAALPQPDLVARQLMVFEELSTRLAVEYVYADFGGMDWEAQTALVRAQIEWGMTDGEFSAALEALVLELPEGTASYTTRADRVQAEFESSIIYEGIGAFVAFRTDAEPRILLLSVIQGSPAERAGLRAHDAVYAVDGTPVTLEEGRAVIDRVRGPAGTEVTLVVASPAESRRLVTVERGKVSASDTLKGVILAPGLIYLQVPVNADDSLLQALASLLQSLIDQEQTAQGLVLDLRIAGSSSQWPLSQMLGLLGHGPMGHFNSRAGDQPVDITGNDFANSQSIPLALLVGPDTSGAPEVFAAALQAIGRGPIIGLPTSGSVLSFQEYVLPDGSLLTFADSSFVTPNGTDLSLSGLTPDLIVNLDWDEVGPGSDPVLLKAIELLQQQS